MPINSKIRILFIIAILFCVRGLVFAETNLSFEIPPPPNSQMIDRHPMQVGNRAIDAVLYQSTAKDYEISDFYANFFQAHEFNKIKDEAGTGRYADSRYLTFKKDDLVVNITIKSGLNTSRVSLAKFLQPEGSPTIAEALLSLKDSPLFEMPKEDKPGKDSKLVPRPPESIRWADTSTQQQISLVYSSPLSTKELFDFYKRAMSAANWEIINASSLSESINRIKKITKEDKVGFQGNEIMGIGSLEELASGGYSLVFYKSPIGQAQITIFSNFINKKAGSMVRISHPQGDY